MAQTFREVQSIVSNGRACQKGLDPTVGNEEFLVVDQSPFPSRLVCHIKVAMGEPKGSG